MSEFYQERTVTARKPHVCCECGRVIPAKEKYQRAVGVWDGEWGHFAWCWDCDNLRDRLFGDGCDMEETSFGTLIDTYNDWYGDEFVGPES
jgi:hypothetical protein